jgi:putative endonuclease
MKTKHYIYILECSDKTLYTGYTNDLENRLKAHNEGKGAKYTKSRLPVKMVYSEAFDDKKEAMSREWFIKHRLTREEKLELIKKGKPL